MSRLSREVIQSKNWIIDGANVSEIVKYTEKPTCDFGAMTSLICPDAVRKVHESYLTAGADIIITNTYSVNYNVLGGSLLSQKDKCENLIIDSVKLARAAVKNCGNKKSYVLGSISEHTPPGKGTDGTCFTIPDWPSSADEEIENFEKTVEVLIKQEIDGIIVEMLKTEDHGIRLLKAVNKVLKAADCKLPVFVGLVPEFKNEEKQDKAKGNFVHSPVRAIPKTATDIRFKRPVSTFSDPDYKDFDFSTENILKFINCLSDVEIGAIMLKHCDFEVVLPAVKILKNVWDGPIGTYPQNGYYKYAEWIAEELDYNSIKIHLKTWIEEGLNQRWIGCRICGVRRADMHAEDALLHYYGHRR